MADDRLNTLFRIKNNIIKNDTTELLENSTKFQNTKRKMNAICRELTLETQKYAPQKTVKDIEVYISSSDKLDRILYSEISNFVFSLETSQRGIFVTNLEKLLLHSLDDQNIISEDSKKMIIKIYDHVQLALYQIENANNILVNSIAEVKVNFEKEIKSVEKEYISILGIFASIVLAFVGGITFSTSVLQNISAVSIFRLLLVVDFLAFVLINVIYTLVKLIFIMNEKNKNFFHIKATNITCLVIAVVIVIAWLLQVNQLPDFMSSFLPWSK